MSFPKAQANTKPKPLLQQQKLEFKTTAFSIKNTPYQKKKKPTHSFQTKKKPHN
jgi:hypothetical protein